MKVLIIILIFVAKFIPSVINFTGMHTAGISIPGAVYLQYIITCMYVCMYVCMYAYL